MTTLTWIWENSDKLSNLATAVTGIATVAAVFFAWWQISKSQKGAQRATAFQMYSDFLRYTLDHPEFLEPDISKKDIERCVWNGKVQKFAEYEVYIDLMIVAFEELMNIDGRGDEDFESYMRSYLDAHKSYFSSERFRQFQNQLKPSFRKFMQRYYVRPLPAMSELKQAAA